ncbi:symporter small accessory protein [Dethiosulfatarculus sandiegensis]|uniref:Uncharacterized protein n=1 Tax=Dethiosulfatarculus sandiegensis TaxID=1429043 RepID=A0A0D2HW25_9BACT|nr:symporter small accessory protein [Dethiosulfatarculus sandiegensis]KIX14573.1 hypothetical protein X474_08290 [Dethiosulfatarculus sandiegensis]
MLGIASTELALVYILCIAASVLCVVYGALKWNDTGPLNEELDNVLDEKEKD